MVNIKEIKKCMVDYDMNQEQLGKALNLSKSSINMKMTGQREFKIDELCKMAKLFNVDINIFLNKEFTK